MCSMKAGELDAFPSLGDNLSAAVTVNVSDLRHHEKHPFSVSKADITRARSIVKRFAGRTLPILVDDENRVLSGGIFYEAALALGLKSIKVIRQSGLSETDGLLFGTAISKLQTLGEFDGKAMEAALRTFEAQIEDFSAELIGFAPGELDKLIGGANPVEADILPKLQKRAVSRIGTTWRCGVHLVLCGDATSEEALAALLAGETVSVAICDPPFGCKIDGFVSKTGKHREFVQASGEMDDAELSDFFTRFCVSLSKVMKPGGLIYLFIDWRSLGLLQRAAEAVFGKIINLCVWSKDRSGMGSWYRSQHELILVLSMPGAKPRNNIELGKHGRDRSNVWSYPSAASSRKGREGDMLKGHPTPKNAEMIADAIIDSSIRGEIVFDGFLGSGTTLIAAERTGRVFRGIDLDPLYVDLAVRRWQNWTGQQAIEAVTGQTFNEIAKEVEDAEES